MNENDIVAETAVNGWHIATYDDGIAYVTDAVREDADPEGGVLEVARSLDIDIAREAHSAAVSRAARGEMG